MNVFWKNMQSGTTPGGRRNHPSLSPVHQAHFLMMVMRAKAWSFSLKQKAASTRKCFSSLSSMSRPVCTHGAIIAGTLD